MAFALTSPVTGVPVVGLTSPTYTLTADTAPSVNGKQWAVTALGGTQTGVTTTGAASPFTISFFKPAVLKQKKIDVYGNLVAAPMNVYKLIGRKSVKLDGFGNALRTAMVTITFELPAGCEVNDPANVRALISATLGAADQQSLGISGTVIDGVF